MKRILIVSHGFFPEQTPRSFRATELTKEFIRRGYDVSVMAPYRNGIDLLQNEYSFEFLSLGKLKWKIPKFKFANQINRILNRLLPLFFEYPMMELYFKIRKAFKNNTKPFDVVISVAVPYPVHWAIASVWEKKLKSKGTIWIADCGDPYMLQQNDTFSPPFYFAYVEKWFCKKVDFLTVPTAQSFKGYFPEFHHKIKVIPQGFRFEDYIQTNETTSDKTKNSIIKFAYGGSFIPGKRDPKELIEFLKSIEDQYNFEFLIFTSNIGMILPLIGNSKSIKCHEPINRNELIKLFNGMDFLVNFANQGKVQTPSKLIDYIIAEKPILDIETGSLNKEYVLEFLNRNYSNKILIPNPNDYRIENVVSKFESLINIKEN